MNIQEFPKNLQMLLEGMTCEVDNVGCSTKEFTPMFAHGDYCLPNIIAKDNKVNGFIDLGRGGIADIYQDIALCVRSLKHNFDTDEYTDLFFKYLGIEANWEKVEYYILLDELF